MGRERSISNIERPKTGLFFTIVLSALIHLVLFGFLGYRLAETKEEIVVFSPPYSVSLVSSETPGEGGESGENPDEGLVESFEPSADTTVTVPEEKKTEEKTRTKVEEAKVEVKPQEEKETTGNLSSAIEKIRKKVEVQEQEEQKKKEATDKARREKEVAEVTPTKTEAPPSKPSGKNPEGTGSPSPGKPGGGNPYGYDNVFAAGGSGRGVPDAEFSAYYNEIWKRIRSLWAVPDDLKNAGLVAVYGIRIARDGRILDVWLETGSGTERFDDTALRAIKKADPLPPLPPKYSDTTIEVGIRFHSD